MAIAGATAIVILSAGAGIYFASSSSGQVTYAKARAESSVAAATHNPLVRVNLTANQASTLDVEIDGQYRIIAPGTARILAHGDRLAKSQVTATQSSLRIGRSEFRINQLELVPVRSPAIWVGEHQYRGTIRLIRVAADKLIAVNVLPLEEYLASVVNSEMPASFPVAAREAQAIVARSYALSQMTGHPHFDVFATSRSQKYDGYQYRDENGRRLAGESESSREIIRRTSGIVCTYSGRLFTTYYTAACGGRTLRGDTIFTDAASPHQSVPCDWCRDAELYRWETTIDQKLAAQLIRDHFQREGKSFGTLVSIRPRSVSNGDLPYYLLSDGRAQIEVAGTTLRRILPYGTLFSPQFSAEIEGGTMRFAGSGHGHGVGLCQWGAHGLGKSGRSAPEILRYYYAGIELVRLREPSLQ